MKAELRREQILKKIQESDRPISASALARAFKVSRQIIVGDVALLRACGSNIEATARGYIIQNNQQYYGYIGMVVCNHDSSLVQQELYTIVDLGGVIIDVSVEHGVYGQLTGLLNIHCRKDVDVFTDALQQSKDQPLSVLSHGIHMHRIGCKDQNTFQQIKNELINLNICLD